MRIVIDNGQSTAAWASRMVARGPATRQATLAAGEMVADETQSKGRADIATAGRFGPRWTSAFTSKAHPIPDGVTVVSSMSGWAGLHWRPFEEGGEVQGQPLIWIPFSDGDAVGVPLSQYPAPLIHRTSRGGLPLLISTSTHRGAYFGKESITVRKFFHLEEICHDVGETIDDKFETAYQGLAPNG
jgi:hypothetical protein